MSDNIYRPAVAVLCVSPTSAYRSLGVECYDHHRDARTYSGGARVIAHPPCRAWSIRTAHQAKPEPGERELGLWCVEVVRRDGGVIEQPAGSRLLDPCPHGGVLQYVSQAWWGSPTLKPTWLWWCGVPVPLVPFSLTPSTPCDRAEWRRLSRRQRSHTSLAMARWLVDAVSVAR